MANKEQQWIAEQIDAARKRINDWPAWMREAANFSGSSAAQTVKAMETEQMKPEQPAETQEGKNTDA